MKQLLINQDGGTTILLTKLGFINNDTRFTITDSKKVILAICNLLDIGRDYIIILRKRRKV